jgi:hypothetical protein
MLVVGIGFNVIRGLTVGLETAAPHAEFGVPLNDSARVTWSGCAASTASDRRSTTR